MRHPAIEAGRVAVVCPDNDVDFETDVAHRRWSLDGTIEGRAALSRWHPHFAEAFAALVAAEKGEGPALRGPARRRRRSCRPSASCPA